MLVWNPDDPNSPEAEALSKFHGHKGQLIANIMMFSQKVEVTVPGSADNMVWTVIGGQSNLKHTQEISLNNMVRAFPTK